MLRVSVGFGGSGQGRAGPYEVHEPVSSEAKLDFRRFCRSPLQSLMGSHVVVHRSSQIQESLGRVEALEVPHHLVPLLDVSVVAFDRVVIVFEPILPARYGYSELQLSYAVEVPIECPLVLIELVGHEGDKPSLSGWFAAFAPENLVYFGPYELFEPSEEFVEFLESSAPHEPAPEVVLGPAVHGVYAPNLFFPTFSSTSSRCILPLTLGFTLLSFLRSLAYFLVQFRMLPSVIR